MQQTTMLAIFALALALGLVTGLMVVELNTAYAQQEDNRLRACEHAGASHVPFC